jgi:hypothetical protein
VAKVRADENPEPELEEVVKRIGVTLSGQNIRDPETSRIRRRMPILNKEPLIK